MQDFIRENGAVLTFLGVTLGVFISRKFLVLPVAAGLALFQEAMTEALRGKTIVLKR